MPTPRNLPRYESIVLLDGVPFREKPRVYPKRSIRVPGGVCRKGHVLTPKNTWISIIDGRVRYRCATCERRTIRECKRKREGSLPYRPKVTEAGVWCPDCQAYRPPDVFVHRSGPRYDTYCREHKNARQRTLLYKRNAEQKPAHDVRVAMFLEHVEAARRTGLTLKEISARLGCPYSTLYNWRKRVAVPKDVDGLLERCWRDGKFSLLTGYKTLKDALK